MPPRRSTARFRREVDALIGLAGETHGTTATYMDHLGLLYLCAGDNDRAAQSGVQTQYAVALLRSDRIEAARPIVAEVERMQGAVDEPGSQLAIHRGLGEWYLREGRNDEAIRHYRAARELASRPGMAYRWNLHAIDAGLGLALSRAGQSAQAREAYLRYGGSAAYDSRCVGGPRMEADLDRLRY